MEKLFVMCYVLSTLIAQHEAAGPEIQVIGCPHTILSISCAANTVIQITSADYGRHSNTLCPHVNPDTMQNTQCFFDETTKIANQCNGQFTCQINVDDQSTDPCVGTFKYLTVNYVCNERPSGIQVIGCPHTTMTLTCPLDFIVKITSADYGRHSTALCPYENPVAMQNIQCSMDETQKMAVQCDGKQICNIVVDDQSTDPCVGTYKYVTINYVCNPKIVCGVNEEYACDNPCKHCNQQPRTCRNSCEKQCVCKEGFKRDAFRRICIDERYCPISTQNGDINEVYSECNANCQKFCHNLQPNCTGVPCVAGYKCNTNYVRDTYTGYCVNPVYCY